MIWGITIKNLLNWTEKKSTIGTTFSLRTPQSCQFVFLILEFIANQYFGLRMECYAIHFYRIPRRLPFFFCCRELFSFCHICCVSSLFWSPKRRVRKNNSPKLEKIPFMKNYGITLIRGNYATSGQQIDFSFWDNNSRLS